MKNNFFKMNKLILLMLFLLLNMGISLNVYSEDKKETVAEMQKRVEKEQREKTEKEFRERQEKKYREEVEKNVKERINKEEEKKKRDEVYNQINKQNDKTQKNEEKIREANNQLVGINGPKLLNDYGVQASLRAGSVANTISSMVTSSSSVMINPVSSSPFFPSSSPALVILNVSQAFQLFNLIISILGINSGVTRFLINSLAR